LSPSGAFNGLSISSFTEVASLQPLLLSGKPSGFEHFYPKRKGTDPDKSGGNNETNKKKDDRRNDGDGNKPDSNTNAYMLGLVALAGSIFILDSLNRTQAGVEVNWQEFRNYFLETGKVERLIVVNNSMVRVQVRPSRPLAPPPLRAEARGNEQFETQDIPAQSQSQLAAQSQQVASATPVFFTIGSVESFERKLEEAQREMGVEPRNFVPVQYVTEVNRLKELFSMALPFVAIGVMTWLAMRQLGKMSGGGGGMGGGRNIFSVGKAKPTIIKGDMKVKVKFDDVAGLTEAKAEVLDAFFCFCSQSN